MQRVPSSFCLHHQNYSPKIIVLLHQEKVSHKVSNSNLQNQHQTHDEQLEFIKELKRNFSGSHEVHPILDSKEDDGSTKKMSSICSQNGAGNREHVSFEEPQRLSILWRLAARILEQMVKVNFSQMTHSPFISCNQAVSQSVQRSCVFHLSTSCDNKHKPK